MIRVIFISLLLIANLSSDTTIELKKGWQFIGFPVDINNTSTFNNDSVDILWGYDASTQTWLGFSPATDKQSKITDQGYHALTSLKAWQGVWIHNKKSWSLSLADNKDQKTDIFLQPGWNLISLPADMSVAPTLFKDDILWRYHDNTWQLSNKNQPNSTIAPPISKIDSAEAIWVKSAKTHTISLDQEVSKLHTFTSMEAVKSYIQEMALEYNIPRFDAPYAYPLYSAVDDVQSVSSGEAATADGSANGAQKADDTTGTNLQEDDVDESDILKHDGQHIFFYDRSKNIVRITTFLDLATAQPTAIEPITLPKNTFLQAMYLHKGKLILVSNEQRYYYAQKLGIDIDAAVMPSPVKESVETFKVSIYDVGNTDDIRLLSATTIDGSFNNSRIIDDDLYIISQFSPQVTITYPKIYIDTKKCENYNIYRPLFAYEDGRYIPECAGVYQDADGRSYRFDYSKPTIKESYLIPMINKDEKPLIQPERFYAPCKLNQFPTITSIAKFDINASRFDQAVSIAGYTKTLYASANNLYLTSTLYPYHYNYQEAYEREMIYKFGIGGTFDYKARGFVDGNLLNQYSLSEYNDTLRIATTSGSGFRGQTDNAVFTLKQKNSTLEIAGSLRGLGHEGEHIQGVRFLKNRAYLVTFRQTDPFYTLDLSDPAHPRSVGELKVNGFSSYIHPVSDDLILTLGRDGGFKIDLYDVSNFANPTKADEKVYGSSFYGFDAEYTPQAFIYRASDNLFGITYHDRTSSYMDILQVNQASKKLDSIDTITLSPGNYENRGIIFNLNTTIYGALFSGDNVNSKVIGAVQ